MNKLIPLTILLTAAALGCIQVTNNNVEIQITRYTGNCMPPVEKMPCCVDFPEKNAEVWVDGDYYTTNSNGRLALELEDGNHWIRYNECWDNTETLEFKIENGKIYYNKTRVYSNAAYQTEPTQSNRILEVNMPCCTA